MAGTVLLPFSRTTVGGSNVFPALLARHFHETEAARGQGGWDVRVCLTWRGDNAHLFETPSFTPDYLGVRPVRERGRHPLLERLRVYGLLWRVEAYGAILSYLRRQRPDVLHVHNASDLMTWGRIARGLGIPVIWHVHTHETGPKSSAHLRLCDHMIFVAHTSRRHFERLPGLPPCTTIHNAVDSTRFHPPADPAAAKARLGLANRVTIGFVGNMVERKRPEWAVRAALDLLARGHDVQFVMVGQDRSADGSYGRRLERMIEEAGAAERVRLLGFRDDVPDVMRAMDVFLLTSEEHGEAFPLVVLEAMASRAAVVSTRSAGVPEAIDHERTGLLTDPHEYEAFLAGVERVVTDEALRERLARAALEEARTRFSLERCAREVRKVYASFVTRSGAGALEEARG